MSDLEKNTRYLRVTVELQSFGTDDRGILARFQNLLSQGNYSLAYENLHVAQRPPLSTRQVNDDQPLLIMMRGLPGAGKTTCAKQLHAALQARGRAVNYVSRDRVRSRFIDPSIDEYDEKLESYVRTMALVEVAAYRRGGMDVVYDATNLGAHDPSLFGDLVQSAHPAKSSQPPRPYAIVEVSAPLQVCISRRPHIDPDYMNRAVRLKNRLDPRKLNDAHSSELLLRNLDQPNLNAEAADRLVKELLETSRALSQRYAPSGE